VARARAAGPIQRDGPTQICTLNDCGPSTSALEHGTARLARTRQRGRRGPKPVLRLALGAAVGDVQTGGTGRPPTLCPAGYTTPTLNVPVCLLPPARVPEQLRRPSANPPVPHPWNATPPPPMEQSRLVGAGAEEKGIRRSSGKGGPPKAAAGFRPHSLALGLPPIFRNRRVKHGESTGQNTIGAGLVEIQPTPTTHVSRFHRR